MNSSSTHLNKLNHHKTTAQVPFALRLFNSLLWMPWPIDDKHDDLPIILMVMFHSYVKWPDGFLGWELVGSSDSNQKIYGSWIILGRRGYPLVI